MKTIRLILIMVFTFFFAVLDAQLFVGGNIGLNASGSKHVDGTVTTDGPKDFGFNVTPRAGKFLSENVALGLDLNFAYDRSESFGNVETVSKNTTFGFSPFVRYYAIRVDKFSIFGQANIGVSFSGSSNTINGVTTNGPKTTHFNVTVGPDLAYDISEKISLETSLNFLNISYINNNTKSGTSTSKSSSFNFGAGTGILSSLGQVTIGAIFKF